jgi:hypothetical protein
VVASWLMSRTDQDRKPFVGGTDPASGLRCRITVSSGWKQGDGFLFYDPPLLSTQRWINRELLDRADPQPPALLLSNGLRKFYLRDGYPELKQPGRFLHLTHLHLQVGGYPATLLKYDALGPPPYHCLFLLVYVNDNSKVYSVFTSAAPSNADMLEREMQAIIASFHIEKVTGGKR